MPKLLDEKVARFHLDKLGVRLTELTDEQAAYIGLLRDGRRRAQGERVRLLGHEEGPREDGRAKQAAVLDDYAAAVRIPAKPTRRTGPCRPPQGVGCQ